jgi:hypothetical protein
VDHDCAGFTEFYRSTRDDCLRAVFASVGDRQAAEDLVAEALAALGALVIFETGPAKQLAHGCPLAISLPRVIEFKPLTQAVAIKIQPGKIPAHAVLRIALPAGVLASGPGPRSVSIRDVPVPRAVVCKPLTPIARAR